MLKAIIQAMDEKLTPIAERLENLEERILLSGVWSDEYEARLDASIDGKLSPVLERLDRVEKQLRELTAAAPEVPDTGTAEPEVLPVSVPAEAEYEEPAESVDIPAETESWDPAEYWDYVLDLEELAERADRLETAVDARLTVWADAVGIAAETVHA